jgi:hypothetical protein
MPVRDLLFAPSGAASYGPSDPYFDYVGAQLNGDGTNGAQNNTFLDSSTNNFTITRNGNTTQGSFSPYGSLWSNYLSGSSWLSVSSGSISSGADFTVEFWVYPTAFPSGANQGIFALGDSRFGVICTSSGGNIYVLANSGDINTGTNMKLNAWNHIALSRNSGTLYVYLNGVSIGNASNTDSISGNWRIAKDQSDSQTFNCYMSNARVVSGTGLYPSGTTFTPSTTPLTAVSGTQLLTCQSNQFKDSSSNNYTITLNGSPSVSRFSPFNPTAPYSTSVIGGSGYFDGSSYLRTSSSIGLGSTYTFEAWVYFTSLSSGGSAENSIFGSGASQGIDFGYGGSTGTRWYMAIYGAGFTVESANTTVNLNTWYHVAWVKNGSTGTIYVNGVQVATGTYNPSSPPTTGISISSYGAGGGNISGYISDARYVNGTAVYTTTFTPPTVPLTAISNTALLCNMTNAGIPDLAMQNDWITNGGTQVSTGTKKFGTGSLYMNSGSLQCFPLKNASGIATFAGDFTWEYWFYPTNGSNNYQGGGLSYRDSSFSSGGFQTIYDGTTGTINFIFDGGGTSISGNTITNNTWNYITLVRQSGTLSIYINGTRKNTASYSNTITGGASSTLGFFIGDTYDGNHYYVQGYMDDIRITNGYARYSGTTMIVPTAALPTY